MPNSAQFDGEHLELLRRDGVRDGLVDAGRRHVVVGGRDGELGVANRAPGQSQAVEGLWGGDLVHEMEVHEEEVRLALGAAHDVAVPHLLAEGRVCVPSRAAAITGCLSSRAD